MTVPELPADLIEFLPCPTPVAWVEAALTQQDVLLLDHRNCELKAAATAMSLIARYGQDAELSAALSKLAREELVHHEQVLRILKRRGIALRPLTASRYASGLRAAVRTHEPAKLVDTLIVGAFIEARSCERFAALVPHLDEELAVFYAGLLQSESRHYQGYLRFARRFGEARDVARAIERIRQVEHGLIESPDETFRFHSGCPGVSLSA
ncbi:MAG: tRNA isopentenyl-2-thiomethyl-A-37 hydroxylase MiaE [Castellaniella sp.]|uniref:tRNA-(ms[2]io[6]A)-hydroxylase n=1 Tax=Castellaniella sp. TaxID=1955812 RepID=UPI002A36BBFD|nr:tRNA isopentenyl-2-thiomethyl-A-37 hydroxylase MiaE [Castellaniella sp.]MDY0309003.1 tRNA isopentenyl-2-thiomethyl-A-37 hydroxylase MiaE [Castellaniella sp.]